MGRRDDLVFGRHPAVSRQLVVLAVGVLALGSATFYTDVNTLWPLPLAASGAVLVVALTAVVAHWNEGLAVTWWLAFAAVLPAFVFYPPRGPTFAVGPETAPYAVVRAAVVALVLGSVGFGLGAGLRRRVDRRRDEPYVPSAGTLPALLVGRDRRLAGRWLLVAGGEFAVVFGGVWLGVVPLGLGLGGQVGVVVLLALMALPALAYASRNDGLLVATALAFAPLFGVFLSLQLRGGFSPAPERPALYALGAALLFAVPVGTVAFLLGAGGAALRLRFQRPAPAPGSH